jgi:hypothetical protein
MGRQAARGPQSPLPVRDSERPPVDVADSRAPTTGPKNSPVTLVEFGDFVSAVRKMSGVVEEC